MSDNEEIIKNESIVEEKQQDRKSEVLLLDDIIKLKKAADEDFKLKNYKTAIKEYNQTIEAITKKFEDYYKNNNLEEGTHLIENLGVPTYLNLSKCYYREENYKDAAKISSKILEIKENNTKALYLRIKSYLELNELDLVEKDLEKLKTLMKGTSELEDLVSIYNEKLSESKIKEMKMFRKMVKSNKVNKSDNVNIESREDNEENSHDTKTILFSLLFLYEQVLLVFNYGKDLFFKSFKVLVNHIISFFTGYWEKIISMFEDIVNFLISSLKFILKYPIVAIMTILKETKNDINGKINRTSNDSEKYPSDTSRQENKVLSE